MVRMQSMGGVAEMAAAKAKTINLLLYEGDLNGVISIEDSHWNSGELYSAPRESVTELIASDACKKFGVYMLLSQKMVYVGQSSDLSKRINQHLNGKDWWESVVILTTSNDSLTHTDIDYLEAILIDKAQKLKHLDCDNKTKGNNPKVSKFRKVELDQYLEEALFLMQLIGITVFNGSKGANKSVLIDTLDPRTKLVMGKRAKKEAMDFLKAQGIALEKNVTYAVKSEDKDECWANPQVSLLQENWDIILNNNSECELILLHIPANALSYGEHDPNGLLVRSDRKLLDLYISTQTFVERKSGKDFSKYIVKRIKY